MNKFSQHLENVKTLDRLTARELTRALRDAVMAEQDAIKQYETVVDSTDNIRVKEVLQDIANEEKVHIGELQTLLAELLPDEAGFLEEGADEVKEAYWRGIKRAVNETEAFIPANIKQALTASSFAGFGNGWQQSFNQTLRTTAKTLENAARLPSGNRINIGPGNVGNIMGGMHNIPAPVAQSPQPQRSSANNDINLANTPAGQSGSTMPTQGGQGDGPAGAAVPQQRQSQQGRPQAGTPINPQPMYKTFSDAWANQIHAQQPPATLANPSAATPPERDAQQMNNENTNSLYDLFRRKFPQYARHQPEGQTTTMTSPTEPGQPGP